MEALVLVLGVAWFVVIVYVLHVLRTVVAGLRSVNVGVQRTAEALERMEASQRRPL